MRTKAETEQELFIEFEENSRNRWIKLYGHKFQRIEKADTEANHDFNATGLTGIRYMIELKDYTTYRYDTQEMSSVTRYSGDCMLQDIKRDYFISVHEKDPELVILYTCQYCDGHTIYNINNRIDERHCIQFNLCKRRMRTTTLADRGWQDKWFSYLSVQKKYGDKAVLYDTPIPKILNKKK